MESSIQKLDRLKEVTGALVERYRKLQREYEQLQQEYFELVETINKQKEQIEILESKNKTNHISQTLLNRQANQTKTKQIINEMMREVDECLLLLNQSSDPE